MSDEQECKKVRETLNLKLEVTVLGVSFMLMSLVLCVMFHFHKKQIQKKESEVKNRINQLRRGNSTAAQEENEDFLKYDADKLKQQKNCQNSDTDEGFHVPTTEDSVTPVRLNDNNYTEIPEKHVEINIDSDNLTSYNVVQGLQK